MRWLIAGGALVLSILITYEAFNFGPNSGTGSLLMNLASEIVGITVTVAIVDWLMERRTRSDEARRIAWNVLHDIDHAVWVWQGGGREFDINELITLLEQVSDDDPLPPFTQSLLMVLGSKSENTIRFRDDIMREHRVLKGALTQLSKLSNIRDSDPIAMTAEDIAQQLKKGVQQLVKETKLIGSTTRIEGLKHDSSIKMQKWRHYGETFDE